MLGLRGLHLLLRGLTTSPQPTAEQSRPLLDLLLTRVTGHCSYQASAQAENPFLRVLAWLDQVVKTILRVLTRLQPPGLDEAWL